MTIPLRALSLVEKGGAGPSSLYTMLEGRTEYVCKMDVKSPWTPTWHQMDYVAWSLEPFLKPPLNNGRPITKPWRPWHYECSVDLFYFIRREDSHGYKFIEKAFG